MPDLLLIMCIWIGLESANKFLAYKEGVVYVECISKSFTINSSIYHNSG